MTSHDVASSVRRAPGRTAQLVVVPHQHAVDQGLPDTALLAASLDAV
jgi:hypothetical protein